MLSSAPNGVVPVPPTSAQASGQTAGILLVAGGLYTFFTVLLPRPAGFQTTGVLLVAAVGIVGGVLCLRLPWQRVPDTARLALAPAAMALIALHNVFGGVDPFRYGMFFCMVFVWLGLCETRWRSLAMTPLVLVAYLTPLVLRDASASDIASISYAIPLYLTVGEVLAWRTARVRQLQHSLRVLAERDMLTGLCNRGVFDTALRAACEQRARIAVLFIDLDGFKQVNDRLGHPAGDAVLTQVADVLRQAVRVGEADLPCRLAGDEFVVLVYANDPERVGRRVADRLLVLLGGIRSDDGRGVRASIGVASGVAVDAQTIIRCADAAMYEAKRAGGGDVVAVEFPPALDMADAAADEHLADVVERSA